MRKPGSRWRTGLDVAAATLSIIAAVVMTYLGVFVLRAVPGRTDAESVIGGSPIDRIPVSYADAATIGSKGAAVVLIEYSDFECPVCARFYRTVWPELARDYIETGKVLFVYKHLPLESIHPAAFKAAEASECAREQNRFWQAHDWFHANRQNVRSPELLPSVLDGIEVARFNACLSEGRQKHVRADLAEAARLGVRGTPTFVIGNRTGDESLVGGALIRGLPKGRELFAAIELALAEKEDPVTVKPTKRSQQ